MATAEVDSDEKDIVVADVGSGVMKAGFAGDDAPYTVFPNFVVTPHFRGAVVGGHQKDHYVGDEAIQNKFKRYGINYPITKKYNDKYDFNWDAFERVWNYVYYVCLYMIYFNTAYNVQAVYTIQSIRMFQLYHACLYAVLL